MHGISSLHNFTFLSNLCRLSMLRHQSRLLICMLWRMEKPVAALILWEDNKKDFYWTNDASRVSLANLLDRLFLQFSVKACRRHVKAPCDHNFFSHHAHVIINLGSSFFRQLLLH